jgi:hypothetical protein
MTYFVKNGNTFMPADEKSLDIHETLPVGNYTIKMDNQERFFFEEIDAFTSSGKIYGDTLKSVTRVMRSFDDRPASTGVLLTGEKGSGKTLMAKLLSMECAKLNIPCIVINTPWHGEKFNTLIQNIQQPCMILFDEFEKVYDREHQPSVLTLLDGVFPSKKLFVLTCNDKWRIDEHMRNRPGRIFYLLDFRGLDVDFITEYCQEKLNDKDQIENICRISSMFAEFNFDMLKALVEEMNRFNETAQEAMKMLNAKPQCDDSGRFKVSLKVGDRVLPDKLFYPTEWDGNPLSKERFTIEQYEDPDSDDDEFHEVPEVSVAAALSSMVASSRPRGPRATPAPSRPDDGEHEFTYLHLTKIDPATGSFTYNNGKGATVMFTKIKSQFNIHAF